MMDYQELKKIGLSDKEAKIYFTSLQRGPETAPTLAKLADIVRPTAYVIIDGLVKRGLMSSITKGNKLYYSAESPEHLLSLINLQKRELDEREREFKRFLPTLESLVNISGEKPRVRVFEGIEGLKSIREDIIRSKTKEIYSFVPSDELYNVFSEKEHNELMTKRRIEKKIKSYMFFTGLDKNKFKSTDKAQLREAIYIDKKEFPFSAGIDIFENKVGIYTFKKNIIGILIENVEIAQTLKTIFKMLWQAKRLNND